MKELFIIRIRDSVCVCVLNVFVNILRNTEYEFNLCPIMAGLKHLINDIFQFSVTI